MLLPVTIISIDWTGSRDGLPVSIGDGIANGDPGRALVKDTLDRTINNLIVRRKFAIAGPYYASTEEYSTQVGVQLDNVEWYFLVPLESFTTYAYLQFTYVTGNNSDIITVEIDGPIVKLRLQGACGSCPSSAMTLRMGIERKLREVIPEIAEIEQVF